MQYEIAYKSILSQCTVHKHILYVCMIVASNKTIKYNICPKCNGMNSMWLDDKSDTIPIKTYESHITISPSPRFRLYFIFL